MKPLPTWIEIDLDALAHNLGVIRSLVGERVRILLVAKADAYGHGAVEIARAAEAGVDGFAVAAVDEADELAGAGVAKPLLIISPLQLSEIPRVVRGGFSCTVTSHAFADALSNEALRSSTQVDVHVEIDTGMGRAGVLAGDVEAIVTHVDKLPGLRLEGLFTHFADAEADREFTLRQISDFRSITDRLRTIGIQAPVLHAANSAAIAAITESHFDMVRPGLIAYGHRPGSLGEALDIRPVMHWKSRIGQIRDIPEGATVSYGRTFTAQRPTRMAVLAVGYADGYRHQLSNRAEVIVSGRRVPVLGRVTMDMTMVDVTDISPPPQPGDPVILMGEQGDDKITVGEIARWSDTIPYEILTGITRRVPRVYLRGGKIETHKSLLGVTDLGE